MVHVDVVNIPQYSAYILLSYIHCTHAYRQEFLSGVMGSTNVSMILLMILYICTYLLPHPLQMFAQTHTYTHTHTLCTHTFQCR